MTRFYVVSDGEPSLEASDCTTFTATGSASALPDMLKELDAQGMTLVSIHDRPAKTTLGQYVYVVECSGGIRNKKMHNLYLQMRSTSTTTRLSIPANEETQDESE